MKSAKKLISILLCLCMVLPILLAIPTMAESEVTITFDDKGKRTSFTDELQVWEENGITVTNNKASSSNKMGDYADPVRFYKNSSVTIEYTQEMSQIIFTCSNATQAGYLVACNLEGGTVATDGSVVTLTLDTPAASYTIPALSGGQVRFNSITVVSVAGTEPEITEPEITEPEVTEPEVTKPGSGDKDEDKEGNGSAETGDEFQLFFWTMLMLSCGGAMVYLTLRKKLF